MLRFGRQTYLSLPNGVLRTPLSATLRAPVQLSLLSVLPEQLVEHVPTMDLHEARRLLSLAHRHGQLPAVTPAGVRRSAFFDLRDSVPIQTLEVISRRPSAIDPFVKYAFRTHDNAILEAVRIPLEKDNRYVVCVSSQTGCSLACAFCATGRIGAGRNLEPWEIVDQVRQVRKDLPAGARVHGVVFQGMGEPLANVKSVIQSIRVLTDPSLQSIDGRAITVSTAGLIRPLPQLLNTLPRTRLGVSIGHADPARRLQLMPVQSSNPLEQVVAIAADHARATGIATMLSYTLLRGINDGDDDAQAFAFLAQQYQQRAGLPPRISLIAYNPIGQQDPFSHSEPDVAERFRQRLRQIRVPVVRRYSGGSDVGAACGQLGMDLARR